MGGGPPELRKFMIKQKTDFESQNPNHKQSLVLSKLSKATRTTTPMVIKQGSECEQKGHGVSCPSETVSSLGLFRNTLTFSSTFPLGAKCHFRQGVYFEDNVHCALLPFLLKAPCLSGTMDLHCSSTRLSTVIWAPPQRPW